MLSPFFFFNDTATTEIYPLSLHDALPIYQARHWIEPHPIGPRHVRRAPPQQRHRDRKSTRLNSSHDQISYAVFCLKKKKATHWECPGELMEHRTQKRVRSIRINRRNLDRL